MAQNQELSRLFSPVTIHGLELANRAVMPAMATGYSNQDNTVSERLTGYLAARARGGAGLIITEICAVDPRGRNFPAEVGIWDDRFIPGLASLADAIHREGAKAAVQLHHAGRETFKDVIGMMPEAPSAVPSAILNQPCEAMSVERIHEITGSFASAALRAKQAGFDAVEVHGAHGYLLTQFLSPFSNHRADEYGGSDGNRARFVLEVLRAVRAKVGPDFPVIIRISTDELIRDGFTIDFMRWLAPQLVEAGAGAIHASVGVYSTPGNLSIASADTEEGFNLKRARAIKEVVSVPVIGVGRIHDPRLAEAAIARGDADLVSFGRQHIADPQFLAKARRGEYDDIRWCMACNQGCIERLSYEMKSATCSLNPECGKEFKGAPARVDKPKKVWVIGAGPAGLSAALAASDRGHRVTVFEREKNAGGQLISASMPPHKEGIARWTSWALRQIAKKGIELRCGAEVGESDLAASRPDAVIVASGALPSVPDIPGIHGKNVYDARDVLVGSVELKGPAVILGAGYVGMETADFLLSRGIAVTILEKQAFPPVGNFTAHGYWLHRRIKKSGGRLVLGAEVKSIEQNAVVYAVNGETQRIGQAAMIVTALGVRPEDGVIQALDRLGIAYQAAGDVRSPRRILEAIHEGHAAGLSV